MARSILRSIQITTAVALWAFVCVVPACASRSASAPDDSEPVKEAAEPVIGATCQYYPPVRNPCGTGTNPGTCCQLGLDWGVCRDLHSDPNNCGSCGHACSFANASATCSSSTCVMGACNAGFGNCDGNAANGCETNLNTTVTHCGSCGTACGLGQICSSGSCVNKPCAANGDCVAGTVCVSSTCQVVSCTGDTQCGTNGCCNGASCTPMGVDPCYCAACSYGGHGAGCCHRPDGVYAGGDKVSCDAAGGTMDYCP